MSIVTQADVHYRRFNGYLDPRYPQGHWFAKLNLTGDASGGVMQAGLVFTRVAQARNSRLYSLEQVSLFSNNNGTPRPGRLFTTNMVGPPLFSLEHRQIINTGADAEGASSTVQATDLAFLPLFLGSQNAQGTTSELALTFANADGVVHALEAEGYWWGARSVLADGGPQRPPTGLYPA